MAKILLAEDDRALGETIVDTLEEENHFVDWQVDGRSALDFLKTYQYDLVILDWEMPNMTGIDVCSEYRNRGGKAPVLFLTQRSSIGDKVKGFGVGGDDYLGKPFFMKELVIRVQALLRRPVTVVNSETVAGDLCLNSKTREFSRNGKEIKLSAIEFSLMELFLRNPGVVFSNETILDRVWPNSSERTPHTLRTFVRRLRLKIYGESEESAIRTVYGVGYKFEQ
jgi:Response regulators consisting of a CheY-like receiver domain and a winged-helix DNA-binding domain